MIEDGEHNTYRKGGSLWVHCYYLSGSLHGEYSHYREDGTLMYRCQYADNARHGEHKYYFESGSLMEHCYYVHGDILVDLLKDPQDDIALFELQLVHGGQLL